jgi:hypothetical protein
MKLPLLPSRSPYQAGCEADSVRALQALEEIVERRDAGLARVAPGGKVICAPPCIFPK